MTAEAYTLFAKKYDHSVSNGQRRKDLLLVTLCSWEDFYDRFIDPMFFGLSERDNKRFFAMKKLWEKVPQEDLDKLPGFLIVFAPATNNWGEVFGLALSGPEDALRGALIYLSPKLEKMKNQEDVDSTVAHEFAHAVLGCWRFDYTRGILSQGAKCRTPGDILSEQDADALIRRWGFKPVHESNRKK